MDRSEANSVMDQSEDNSVMDHSEANSVMDHSEDNSVMDVSEANSVIDHLEEYTSTNSYDRAFECPNCGKTFAYRKRFINHMEICAQKAEAKRAKKITKTVKKPVISNLDDKEDIWYDCSICEQKFKNKMDLNCHLTSHSQDKPFECIECGRRFSKKTYLIRHIPTHAEEKWYICNVCDYQVSRPDRYKMHMQCHGVSNPFKCSLCGKGFPGLKELNKHLNSHNSSALDPGANTSSYQGVGLCVFNCVECGLKFDKAEKYKQHMLKHGIEEPYECSLCGQSFSSKLQLNRHLSHHNNSVLQAATDDPERLSYDQNGVEGDADTDKFRIHSDTESPEKCFSYHNNGVLKASTGVPKGSSGILKASTGKSKPNSSYHNSVVKASANISNANISIDGVSMPNSKTNLMDSDNSSRGVTSGVLEAEDHMYSCKVCELRFHERKEHSKHMKTHQKKLFPCSKCGKAYTRRSNLNRHFNSCTSDFIPSSYICTTCEISFSCSKELDEHIITHVTGAIDSASIKEERESSMGDKCVESLERSCYINHSPAVGAELPKKKKKVKHKSYSHKFLDMNDYATQLLKKKVNVKDKSSSHTLDMYDYGSQLPKKKTKIKQVNDHGDTQLPKKKFKVKDKLSSHTLDTNDYGTQVPKKKMKHKSSSQVLDMIEYELSKYETTGNLSIPTVHRREHEESVLEYEKLVVYEFMNMKPVLPELDDHAAPDTLHDVVKINDQISLKFFM